MPHLKSMQPFKIRMILPYIPPVLCAVAACHGEAVARDQEDVTRNGILVLQACTDEKTTAEHSREISLIFKGVLLNETIQALFKADRNHLYHAVLLAEVERMNHHEWFGLPSMQDYSKKIRNDRFPLTAAMDPNAVFVIREVIIKEVGNLQGRNPQANIPGLISDLVEFYKVFDPELYVKVMEFEDNSLIRSFHILKNIDFQALGADPLAVTTIRHLVDEVFWKYSLWQERIRQFQREKK
ncbi:MAG: hypothetical protein LUE13_09390 [Akkermansiaceae bacterium]|nr:hypothetical protein [Akkermansiaceae bacterium]